MVAQPRRPAAKTVTKAEFARIAGVTRGGITLAQQAGLIVVDPQNRVSLDHPTNRAYLERKGRRTQAQRKARRSTRRRQAAPAADRAPPSSPGRPPRPPKSPRGGTGRTPGGNGHDEPHCDGETFTMAELRDKIAAANLKEQKLSRERDELVERSGVVAVFAAVYHVHQGQLSALAQKLGPEIVVALGLTDIDTARVQELMDLEVRRALGQIKREMDAWLTAHAEEPLAGEAEAGS